MATPDHYRSEAARCRELAAKSTDAAATRRWLELALDYEQLARSLSGVPRMRIRRRFRCRTISSRRKRCVSKDGHAHCSLFPLSRLRERVAA